MKEEAIRDGFGRGLLKLGELYPNVLVVSADLSNSTRASWFAKKYPSRAFNVGISEQDMIGVSAGLASCGKIVFANSFAIFIERAFEIVRNLVARQKLNVKIIGSHAGLATGEDGSSAQSIEDIALFRVLPNMVVLSPADSLEAEKLTLQMAELNGPMYMRLVRKKTPILKDEPVRIGEVRFLKDGADVSIFATGAMVSEALKAREKLLKEKIQAEVIDVHTIKPLDTKIKRIIKNKQLVVTCEDHNIIGGLGGALAELLSKQIHPPIIRIGVRDTFGESGSPDQLYIKYGLSSDYIAQSIKRFFVTK